MSKIGSKPISISQEINLNITGKKVQVSGKHGTIIISLPKTLDILNDKNSLITVLRKSENAKARALHGLYRSLLANAIEGVQKPWQKRLEIVGTGYNVKLQGEDLVIKVGYSHPVIFKKIPDISFSVEGNSKIIISGVNKQLVGQIAHQIKIIRKPDVYKGKGIRYEGEQLRIKPGKKAKTAGA